MWPAQANATTREWGETPTLTHQILFCHAVQWMRWLATQNIGSKMTAKKLVNPIRCNIPVQKAVTLVTPWSSCIDQCTNIRGSYKPFLTKLQVFFSPPREGKMWADKDLNVQVVTRSGKPIRGTQWNPFTKPINSPSFWNYLWNSVFSYMHCKPFFCFLFVLLTLSLSLSLSLTHTHIHTLLKNLWLFFCNFCSKLLGLSMSITRLKNSMTFPWR